MTDPASMLAASAPSPDTRNGGAGVAARSMVVDPELVRVLDDHGVVVDAARDPNLPVEHKLRVHRSMLRTRIVDTHLEKLQRQGRIAFHVSSLGEEASIVASAAALSDDDWIVPCYREIGALFHRGYSLASYLDMMFGNADDAAHGRQMPEHTTCRALRYASVSAPIGTQIPHAVGMAYALKLRRAPEVAAVYFGDGATSSNDFHAGLNFAGVWKAPVIFLCRNNRWAISLPSEEQTAAAHFADKAIGYGMPGVRCDGNDPLAVHVVVAAARARALAGGGPTLVEMVTYRQGGHSTSDDPSIYRAAEELDLYVAADPVARFHKHLVGLGVWSDEAERAFRREVEAELKAAIASAESKPRPALASMFDGVFATRPQHLEAQFIEASRGARAPGAS